MIIGIPDGTQRWDFPMPWPPTACSARLASKILWYSGVSGACWAWPAPLVGSNDGGPPIPGTGNRVHMPFQSGYIESSKARAPANVAQSAAKSTIAPIDFRWDMAVLLVIRPPRAAGICGGQV